MKTDPAKKPRLSVITPSLNTGRFLEATIESVLAQSYEDFEFIVIDGGSTDGTLETLKKYPQIRVISEKGTGYWAALERALDLAQGEYVTNCAISDGYLDKDWFKKCVEALDADKKVSVVWGLAQYMDEEGKLLSVAYPQFHNDPAPQKEEFFYYWLAGGFWLPEGNLCMRKEVFRKSRPTPDFAIPGASVEPWLPINFNFNAQGYLALFLPTVASYGRIHAAYWNSPDFLTELEENRLRLYLGHVAKLRRALLWGGKQHVFRDGEGDEIPVVFSRWRFVRSQFLSPARLAEHAKRSTKYAVRHALYLLGKNGLTPEWMKRALMNKRKARFGA